MIAEKPQRQNHAMYHVGAITRTNNSTTLDHKDNVYLIREPTKFDVHIRTYDDKTTREHA